MIGYSDIVNILLSKPNINVNKQIFNIIMYLYYKFIFFKSRYRYFFFYFSNDVLKFDYI